VDTSGIPMVEGGATGIWKITANPAGAVSANAFVTQNRYSGWVANNQMALPSPLIVVSREGPR